MDVLQNLNISSFCKMSSSVKVYSGFINNSWYWQWLSQNLNNIEAWWFVQILWNNPYFNIYICSGESPLTTFQIWKAIHVLMNYFISRNMLSKKKKNQTIPKPTKFFKRLIYHHRLSLLYNCWHHRLSRFLHPWEILF